LAGVEEFMMIENQPIDVEASSRMELEHVEWSHTPTTHVAIAEADINFI
jgi:hypothetical protein